MPFPIPNLDDRTFDQLVDEAKALIPKYFPTWTDHNFSDAGMTFLDLFAFLVENAVYQINRVPERSLEHFASLVGVPRRPDESIETLFRRVREKLDSRERAVTQNEIEEQILTQPAERWPQNRKIARADVITDLQALPGVFPAELRLKIVIVPEPAGADDLAPEPSRDLRQAVFEFVSERVLIATRLQVLAPHYCFIRIKATVVRGAESRLDRDTVRQNVVKAVRDLLHPTRGGDAGRGWPSGRAIFRSELYGIIEGLPGVDHVRELLLLEVLKTDARLSARGRESLARQPGALPLSLPSPNQNEAETRSEMLLPHSTSLVKWDDETFVVTVVDQ